MKLMLAITAAAAILAGASQAAPVAPSGSTDSGLVEMVKKGHGHGKGGYKGNRGRHLGWYKGRGSKHRRGWR